MPSPVFLDGPMQGQNFPIPQSTVEEGQIVCQPDIGGPQVIYTLTRVRAFDRILVVASTAGGMPTLETLFEHLIGDAAKAAAE